MSLGGQVIDFIGHARFDQTKRRGGIGRIIFQNAEIGAGKDAELLQSPQVGLSHAAAGAVDPITFLEEIFREVRAALTCDARNQSLLHQNDP